MVIRNVTMCISVFKKYINKTLAHNPSVIPLELRNRKKIKVSLDGIVCMTDRASGKSRIQTSYRTEEGKTPGFCYVRGARDQWDATKTAKDLGIRIGTWQR